MTQGNTTQTELPWTGERLVGASEGDIVFEHVHRYALALDLAAGKRVLDIACGEGYGSQLLAGVARSVLGVDISAQTVEHASRKYQAQNLKFLVGSCDAMPVESGSIDLVISFETLEHHDRHHEMLAEVKRVLCPGGVLVISTPDKHVYSDLPKFTNSFHVKELYREEFETLLRTHFSHVALLGQRVCEGSLIVPLDSEPLDTPFVFFQGHMTEVRREAGLQLPRYFLALASDGDLPRLIRGSLMGGLPERTNTLEERLYWVNAHLEARNHDLAQCNNMRVALEQRLTGTFNSLSWRLTAPLRWVGDGLRRFTRSRKR
jgi:O-antigen biosynthesis protein